MSGSYKSGVVQSFINNKNACMQTEIGQIKLRYDNMVPSFTLVSRYISNYSRSKAACFLKKTRVFAN